MTTAIKAKDAPAMQYAAYKYPAWELSASCLWLTSGIVTSVSISKQTYMVTRFAENAIANVTP